MPSPWGKNYLTQSKHIQNIIQNSPLQKHLPETWKVNEVCIIPTTESVKWTTMMIHKLSLFLSFHPCLRIIPRKSMTSCWEHDKKNIEESKQLREWRLLFSMTLPAIHITITDPYNVHVFCCIQISWFCHQVPGEQMLHIWDPSDRKTAHAPNSEMHHLVTYKPTGPGVESVSDKKIFQKISSVDLQTTKYVLPKTVTATAGGTNTFFHEPLHHVCCMATVTTG